MCKEEPEGSPGELPRFSDADQAAHVQSEVESGTVNDEPLEDVGSAPQMQAPHGAGLVHVGKTSLRQFLALPLQLSVAPTP